MNIWKNRQNEKQVTRFLKSTYGLVLLRGSQNFLLVSWDPTVHTHLRLVFLFTASPTAAATREEGQQEVRQESARPGQRFCGRRCFAHQRGSKKLHADGFLSTYLFSFPPRFQSQRISSHFWVCAFYAGREGGPQGTWLCKQNFLLIDTWLS